MKVSALTATSIVVFLAVAGVMVRSAAAPARPGDVTEARVLAEAGSGNNWLVGGRTFDEQHFSPLTAISDRTIAGLGLAWTLDLYSPMGLSVEPIVVDGVIYVSAPQSKIYAVDAATGKLLWHFDANVRFGSMRNSWAARTNRGVAVWNGKVYVGTGDCRLVAIEAASGKKAWESRVCDPSVTGITGAPHAGGGRIYIGYNGSDTSVRGSVTAFDANTGKEVWRFWTVPGDPTKGYESKALEMAAKTWTGDDAWRIGGGDVWDPITYDPVAGLVIFGTAGASSGGSYHGDLAGIQVGGDRLFASSIVAVKADTGDYVWHYQTGRSENMHILIADIPIGGSKRRVAMTVPKTGIFYVIDEQSGQLISQMRIDGQPVQPPSGGRGGAPGPGHNWWPMSYSAATGLVYIPAHASRTGETREGESRTDGRLVAWDPVRQSVKWSVEQPLAVNGGVLSTAGNLVFQGEGSGEFAAYTADTGRKMWSVKTGSAIQSVPVTYTVNNEQYVLMPVGLGSGSRLFDRVSTMATPESKQGPSRLFAFKLGGHAAMPPAAVTLATLPRPPEQTASKEAIQKGAAMYDKFLCHDCHAPEADGGGSWALDGAIPDLRYMPMTVHRQFNDIVLRGTHRTQGMPGFGTPAGFPLFKTVMTQEEADALHAYIIDLEWRAYNAEQAAKGSAPR